MMENENLDLDSLMDLLDDDDNPFADESASSATTNSDVKNKEYNTNNKQSAKTRILTDSNLIFPIDKDVKDTTIKESPETVLSKAAKDSVIHTGDADSSDDEESKLYLTKTGKEIKKNITVKTNYHITEQKKTITWNDSTRNSLKNPKTDCFVDSYSGIRIINPLVPYDMMQQRMQGRKMVKMSYFANHLKGGEIDGDWVTIGVLISKLPPKTTKNGKSFSIWKMSDLHNCEKVITVFLFGNAHTEHWKSVVGSVIGILNPSIMPDKNKDGSMSISVDHPGKLMMMGKSKDFGFCKSVRKDGTKCNSVVNLSQCEFCIYHVKKEYQKFSGKRSELQAVFSGKEPSLKNKVLKGQNVFYGGQSFVPLEKKVGKKVSNKDKLTLSNLGLKRKAEVLENEEKVKSVKKLTDLYGSNVLGAAEKNSEFINNKLAIPTAGSRNLLKHMLKGNDNLKEVSRAELLKMRDKHASARDVLQQQQKDAQTLRDLTPKLGKGLAPGQNVSFDFLSHKTSPHDAAQDLAKKRAIQKVKSLGPLRRKDPNSVKTSPEASDRVKSVLNKSLEEIKTPPETKLPESSRLGTLDLNSKKVKEILNRKSSHAYEVEMGELEKQENYFSVREKKEEMEEKMLSTTEVVCDVISCKQCKYTAHTSAERCKKENHPLKMHKAIKRFFKCKDCGSRTFCFKKFPTKSCRQCGGSNYEKTGMWKPRSGPKLDSEILNVDGDEAFILNSLPTQELSRN